VAATGLGTLKQMSAATILVVDDDPVILQLLKINFELEGYRVVTAADGEVALALTATQSPDVVVLDVMMPGMSGLEVAARLREATPRPGVMLLSAKAQSSDVAAGLVLADDYVTKPFDSMDLVGRVAAMISSLGAAVRDD
jgi:DNA-binding response OmpR family regulator